MRWFVFFAFGAMVAATSAAAASRCDRLLSLLGHQVVNAADTTCFESPDLTTANPNTTPADNSLPGLPAFAFTPQTDRTVISPSPPNRTPITKAVPGIQLDARISDDPTGEARILFRLPNQWNGKLAVAGASGTRSEFNGDFAWSDYVLQQGYAYVSQNKGVLNFYLTTAADPLGCRLNPASAIFVHFYDNDPGQPFARWTEFHDRGNADRKECGHGQLWPVSEPNLCGWNFEWRLPGAARARNRAGAVRRRRRLGGHLRRSGCTQSVERVASGNTQFSRLREAPATHRTAPQPRTSCWRATRPTSCPDRTRFVGLLLGRNSGKSRYANGRSGSIRLMTLTSRAPELIATSTGCRPRMSAPNLPR